MNTVANAASRWRKSSWSDGEETCVEVAHTLGAVRDSKNPAGPVLAVDAAALVRAVRAGAIA